MLSRPLDRPLWQPLHRDLDRVGQGIGGGDDGFALTLTAPDGAYGGAPAVVTGGTPIVYMDGEYAPITADVGETITPYMFILDGVETGEWFVSPGQIPYKMEPDSTVQVKDALDRLSNVLVIEPYDEDAADYFTLVEGLGEAPPDVRGKYHSRIFKRLKSAGQWDAVSDLFIGYGWPEREQAMVKPKTSSGWPSSTTLVGANVAYNSTGASKGVILTDVTYLETGIAILDLVPALYPVLSLGIRCGPLTAGIHTLYCSSYVPTGDSDRFYMFANGGVMNVGLGDIDNSPPDEYTDSSSPGTFAFSASSGSFDRVKNGSLEATDSWNNQGFMSGTIRFVGTAISANVATPIRSAFVGRDVDHAVMHTILSEFESLF